MDPAQALADLTEISPQIEAAVIMDEAGTALGSTVADGERTREIARLGNRLLAEADAVADGESRKVTQLQVETRAGSVFAVREEDRAIVAMTREETTVGLVFYDLRSSLRSLREEPGAAS